MGIDQAQSHRDTSKDVAGAHGLPHGLPHESMHQRKTFTVGYSQNYLEKSFKPSEIPKQYQPTQKAKNLTLLGERVR